MEKLPFSWKDTSVIFFKDTYQTRLTFSFTKRFETRTCVQVFPTLDHGDSGLMSDRHVSNVFPYFHNVLLIIIYHSDVKHDVKYRIEYYVYKLYHKKSIKSKQKVYPISLYNMSLNVLNAKINI